MIPEALARTAREVWGADGDSWLAALPGLADLAAQWGLELGRRLLRAAEDALLLERVDPGTAATHLVPDADEQATAAAVEVLRRLHAAAPPAGVAPTDRSLDVAALLLPRLS